MERLNTAFERSGGKLYSLWRLKLELSFDLLEAMQFDTSKIHKGVIVLSDPPMELEEIQEKVYAGILKLFSLAPLCCPISIITDDAMQYYRKCQDMSEWPNLITYLDTLDFS